MGITCSICNNPQRKEIDRAIAEGGTERTIAGLYNLSKSAVQRHRSNCLSAALQAVDHRKAASALEHCLWVVEKLRRMAEEAESHPRQFLATAETLVRSLAVLGRLTGEISNNTNNLFVNLGVRSEEELRGKLDMVKALESQGSPEESYSDWVAMGRVLLGENPSLRSSLAVDLGLDSYAIEVPDGERQPPSEHDGGAMIHRATTNGKEPL